VCENEEESVDTDADYSDEMQSNPDEVNDKDYTQNLVPPKKQSPSVISKALMTSEEICSVTDRHCLTTRPQSW